MRFQTADLMESDKAHHRDTADAHGAFLAYDRGLQLNAAVLISLQTAPL